MISEEKELKRNQELCLLGASLERGSKEGAGTCSKGCRQRPSPPGQGCSPSEPALCRDIPVPQPGWARSWEPLEAGEGRVPAHPGPWKGCQQPAVSGSAGPGEERSSAERQAVGAALCSHRALLCCLLGCRPARRAACSFHKTKQGKKWVSKVCFFPV